MTHEERLKEIENHFKNMNNFGWPEDVSWLIARVKELEAVIEAYLHRVEYSWDNRFKETLTKNEKINNPTI